MVRLSAAMSGTASRGRFGFRDRPGNIRTFALEVNQPDGSDPLERVAEMAFDLGMQARSTADAALAVVFGDPGGFFVDVVDPRFWLLHTTGPSSWLEPMLARLVSKHADVDWCWLPVSLLKAMQAEGRTRWFKSDFRGDELLPAEGIKARRLKVQLEGDDAEELRVHIAQLQGYEAAGSLTGITVVIEDRDYGALTAAAHYRGGFTGHGQSFELHQGFVTRAIGAYATRVRRTEKELALTWDVHENHASLSGHTIEIVLGRAIPDLDRFARGLFAAKEPFRLWATPTWAAEDLIEAEVADLHVGQQFRMDIHPNRLTVYLDGGVCANTVFRLLTNLQHRFDATASARSALGVIS